MTAFSICTILCASKKAGSITHHKFEMGCPMRRLFSFSLFALLIFLTPHVLFAEAPARERGQPIAEDEDIHFMFGQTVAMPPVLQAVADECALVPPHQELFSTFSKSLLAEGTRKVDMVGQIHIELMTVLHGAQEAAGFVKLIEQVKVDSYNKLQTQVSGFNATQKEAACERWKDILLAREQFNISTFIAKYMAVLEKSNASFFEERKEKFVLMGLLPKGVKPSASETFLPPR